MLYKNILKHEAGFDYEFDEGAIVNITNIHKDEFGNLDFDIDGQPAHATVEEFNNSWTPANKVPTFEEWIKDIFKHRVYNVLKDLSNEYAGVPEEIQKKAIEEAVEFFIIEFYEEGQK